MIRQAIGIAVLCAAIITQARAQGLTIELDGGLQGTQYQLLNGQNKPLPAGSLGLLYTFRLGKNWGLITGITAGVYRTQATLPNGTVFSNDQVDDEGSAFQYSMKTEGYKETQQFVAAGVPLLIQYHTAGPGTQWYVNGGGKVVFPAAASIQISAQQLNLSGYYPDYNISVSNLPQHGFGTITNWKAGTTSELKPAAALSVATGLSFKLSGSARLYTGLYIEFGLTDLKSRNDSLPFVTYSPTGVSGIKASSVLNMQNAGQMKGVAFGLQLRLGFGGNRTRSAARPATETESSNPPSPENPATRANPPNPADSLISDDEANAIERPVIFGTIDETILPEIQKTHLDQVAEILLQYPGLRISLVGHICNSETETEKTKVGMARARAVARYLQSKGIDRSRMDVSAVNQSDPVTPFNPPANFQKRRVVITIL
jgi:outer membrane protein OmpA-like peptidoglycan-associated protein